MPGRVEAARSAVAAWESAIPDPSTLVHAMQSNGRIEPGHAQNLGVLPQSALIGSFGRGSRGGFGAGRAAGCLALARLAPDLRRGFRTASTTMRSGRGAIGPSGYSNPSARLPFSSAATTTLTAPPDFSLPNRTSS